MPRAKSTKKKETKKKVLIVEDEGLLIDMYTEKLQHAGFSIARASSSKEASEVAEKEKPDFILLDMLLQDENGLSFLWKRQNDPVIGDIPVIVFSNFQDEKTEREAIRLGALDYLIKTLYTPQEIVDKIKKYLDKK